MRHVGEEQTATVALVIQGLSCIQILEVNVWTHVLLVFGEITQQKNACLVGAERMYQDLLFSTAVQHAQQEHMLTVNPVVTQPSSFHGMEVIVGIPARTVSGEA